MQSPSPSDFAIRMERVTKTYDGKTALDMLNLEVPAGEIFGLLGHNGAGKTTTVSILTTLLRPTSGTATVWGSTVTAQPRQVQGNIGSLPENVQFYDRLTLYFARLSGLTRPASRIGEVLEHPHSTLNWMNRPGFAQAWRPTTANTSDSRRCNGPQGTQHTARDPGDDAIRRHLRQISVWKPRWGYRRAWAQLRKAGGVDNRKKVQRLWREEGLRVPQQRDGFFRLRVPMAH